MEAAATGADGAVSRETTELSASRTSGESPGLRGGCDTVVVLSTGVAAAGEEGQPRPEGRPPETET